MKQHLTFVPPLPTDERLWKRLMNRLYGCEGGRLFEWLRAVRKVVEEAEREKSGGRVA